MTTEWCVMLVQLTQCGWAKSGEVETTTEVWSSHFSLMAGLQAWCQEILFAVDEREKKSFLRHTRKKIKRSGTLSSRCIFSYVMHQIFFNLCRRLMDFRVSQSLTEIVYKTQIKSAVISWFSHDFSLLRDKARLSFLSLRSLTLNSQRCYGVAT